MLLFGRLAVLPRVPLKPSNIAQEDLFLNIVWFCAARQSYVPAVCSSEGNSTSHIPSTVLKSHISATAWTRQILAPVLKANSCNSPDNTYSCKTPDKMGMTDIFPQQG
jgi:hypothetical protein